MAETKLNVILIGTFRLTLLNAVFVTTSILTFDCWWGSYFLIDPSLTSAVCGSVGGAVFAVISHFGCVSRLWFFYILNSSPKMADVAGCWWPLSHTATTPLGLLVNSFIYLYIIVLCVTSNYVGGTWNRRRGQHQSSVSIPPSQRFWGEGRVQVRGQVSLRQRWQLHFYRGKFSLWTNDHLRPTSRRRIGRLDFCLAPLSSF